MVKVVLEAGWIYSGTRYGPGEVDLPDDVHAALKAKGAFESAPADAEAQAGGDAAPPDKAAASKAPAKADKE